MPLDGVDRGQVENETEEMRLKREAILAKSGAAVSPPRRDGEEGPHQPDRG